MSHTSVFSSTTDILIFDGLGEVSMSSQTVNTVEDIFDSSLNLEDTHYKEGYSEGYTDGLSSGKDEGNQVGLKTGFEVGEELGFYRGCIEVWNAAILVEPTCFSSRVQKNIKQMDELLRKYPFPDPENESATDTIDSLRLKFRTISATLNIRLEYDGYPKASTIDKSGF
ncbi:putative 1,4-alpha-glucan-branching enzyme 3, chloroplastic/amyloplastic-like [Capsicum annuum]|nr:putative 1,4-alpha-glucan-branching enzyme 3, chloroplastic/amyloplastic-like [Capsicum annuum]KAF3673619.1 putative 1,4-alpha-glucan-branching enzyme 3, chloroplastic/amyloplastic-like [Capsicum annuum]